jgi:hypothetical protein
MVGAQAPGSHAVHSFLYQLVGSMVPEPVGIFEYFGEKYDVQRGVRGAPWFQLKSKIRDRKGRMVLERRMWQVLKSFHDAIGATETMRKLPNIKPSEELRKAYCKYKSLEYELSFEHKKLIKFAIEDLSIGPGRLCMALPQHGDFCLNNLIIDNEHITVIDFEDYAITTMPLYDHFTLALSLPACSSQPTSAARAFRHDSIITTSEILGIPPNAVKWHFLHHLLLRLGPWSTGERRRPYRMWLKQVLICFLDEQAYYNRVRSSYN